MTAARAPAAPGRVRVPPSLSPGSPMSPGVPPASPRCPQRPGCPRRWGQPPGQPGCGPPEDKGAGRRGRSPPRSWRPLALLLPDRPVGQSARDPDARRRVTRPAANYTGWPPSCLLEADGTAVGCSGRRVFWGVPGVFRASGAPAARGGSGGAPAAGGVSRPRSP
jgi:hypothetical protein